MKMPIKYWAHWNSKQISRIRKKWKRLFKPIKRSRKISSSFLLVCSKRASFVFSRKKSNPLSSGRNMLIECRNYACNLIFILIQSIARSKLKIMINSFKRSAQNWFVRHSYNHTNQLIRINWNNLFQKLLIKIGKSYGLISIPNSPNFWRFLTISVNWDIVNQPLSLYYSLSKLLIAESNKYREFPIVKRNRSALQPLNYRTWQKLMIYH